MENKTCSPEQITLMNQLYKLDEQIDKVHKTIFIYQLYDSQDLGPLTNLHAIASKIIDPQIPVEIVEDWITEHNCKFYYKVFPKHVDPEYKPQDVEAKEGQTKKEEVKHEDNKDQESQKNKSQDVEAKEGETKKEEVKHEDTKDQESQKNKIESQEYNQRIITNLFTFQLEQQGNTQYEWYKKVQIYDSTLGLQTVRIVAIPLPQHFFKAEDVQAKIDEVQKLRIQRTQDTRLDSHQILKQKQAAWDERIKNKVIQYELEEERNHLQMFRLQALRCVLTNKTELISLCGLIDYGSGLSITDAQKQLTSIFKFPSDLQPQYLIYSFNPKPKNPKAKIPEYVNSPQITTIYNLDTQKGRIVLYKGGKEALFQKSHFTGQKQLSISLYSIRLARNNPFMASAIQKFTNGWSNRVSNAIIPIGFVVASIFDDLKIKEDPNSSNFIQADSFYRSKDIKDIKVSTYQQIRFSDLFQRYNEFKDFYLEDKIELKDFYTLEKLGISKLQDDEQMIPRSIDRLTFLFYFTKLNKQFLEKFTATENQGFQSIIFAIDRYIQTVCELINHINDTILVTNEGGVNQCKNLKKYLQFIKFLLNSTILVKNITNRALALTGNLKNFFDALKLKDNWIISYIISNEDSIQEAQPIHYYDFLLRFIRNEKRQKDSSIADDQNIGSIFVTIHKYKADQIAKKFIWDKSKVVQAIRSYSQNILKYEHLMNLNKKPFDKFQIEKKVARLLCVVGSASEAAKIYQRLHMIEKVDQCFKQIMLDYKGQQLTSKIFQFALFFEDEFAYNLAEKYYHKAYSTAKTTDGRKKSQSYLLALRKRQAQPRVDDVTIISNYVADKGSEDVFVKTGLGIKQREGAVALQDAENQYRRLLNLSWDESNKRSIINESIDEQPSILEQ